MIYPHKIIKSRRRTIVLLVNDKGHLIAKAPLHISEREIYNFCVAKEQWIQAKLSERRRENAEYDKFFDCRSLLLNGHEYPIIPSSRVSKCVVDEGLVLVPLKLCLEGADGLTFDPDKASYLVKLIKGIAEHSLKSRLDSLSLRLKLNYDQMRLINARGRWGSCSSDRNISLNLRLACLPDKLADYVIAHELVHLIELNHSSTFYLELSKVLKDHRQLKRELERYSWVMRLYR